MRFDTSELRKLSADLGKADAKVTELAKVVVKKTASDIEASAKIFAPVDTGNLKNSISTDVDGLVALIGPTAEYGEYVERGTKNEDESTRMAAGPITKPVKIPGMPLGGELSAVAKTVRSLTVAPLSPFARHKAVG